MMVGLIRLLMYLWWCTHIDNWDTVSWFAYISDLEFWLAFVWSIILVLLCQHSFGDVWSCFSICSLRLCICFFHCIIIGHIPECLCLVTFCVLCLLLSYTRASPPSLSSSHLLCTSSPLDLFLDLCESSYWGIPPLALFLLGHSPLFGFIMSRADFMVVKPLLSFRLGHPPAVISFRASPYCHFV